MDRPQERKLVERCIAGEDAAWRELFLRYRAVLERAAAMQLNRFGISPDADRVDEICARLFGQLLENDCRVLRTFRWDCSLSTWLVGLCRFSVLRWIQEEKREAGRRQTLVAPEGDTVPDDPLIRKEEVTLLEEALSDLSEKDRRLLEGIYSRDWSYDEVARREEIPSGTVSSRLAFLKKQLLSRLKGLLSILLL